MYNGEIYLVLFLGRIIMELNYFDIVIGGIILLLGLKGIINGFFKELFGLIGIIGGLFIASRNSHEVGVYLNNLVFNFQSDSSINFTGFVATLVVFWAVMIGVGFILKKLSIMSGLSLIDKLLGFVFGASKFFFITAVIVNSLHNIKTIKDSIEPQLKDSIIYPILVSSGAYIMKIDPVEVTKDIDSKVNESVDAVKDNIKEQIKESISKTKEDIQKKIDE